MERSWRTLGPPHREITEMSNGQAKAQRRTIGLVKASDCWPRQSNECPNVVQKQKLIQRSRVALILLDSNLRIALKELSFIGPTSFRRTNTPPRKYSSSLRGE
jgi:hypothetical protein